MKWSPFFESSRKLSDVPLSKALVAALLCSAILTAVLYSGMLTGANLYVSDMMYQRETPLEGNIFILGIDELALENMGPFHTWTRSDMADIIDALNASEDIKPAVIGIDVMYFGQSDPQSDARLVESCARYGNVVTASRANFTSKLVQKDDGFYMDNYAVDQMETPFPALRDVTTMGHISTMADSDGVIRHCLQYIDIPPDLAEQSGVTRSQSFGFSVYEKYAEFLGLPEGVDVPLGDRNEWYIPYSGKPGAYGDGFSVWDVLTGELPPEMFADCVVLIGPYANGLLDSFVAPIDKAQQIFGVEIYANIVDALLGNEFRLELPYVAGVALLFVALFALFFPFFYWNALLSALLMVAFSGLYLLIARQMVFPTFDWLFAFSYQSATVRYMLPPLYIPLGVFLLYVGVLAVNFLTAQRQKRQVTETFRKYVDPAIIDDIFKSGLENLQLGGKSAEICVMFVDIRGFTPMSEVMQSQEVVSMLGEYLEITSSAIFKHRGTLDKFIGDATMAFWGAPLPLDDYIYKSVLAAWDIVQSGLAMEESLRQKYGRTVSFGIGLHCGEAVVGNIGTVKRVDYTAIGNTVNTAARLESNAKPAQVLMSEAVYKAVQDRVTARCIGNIPLKGKSEELTVYALEHISEYEGVPPLPSAQLTPGK